MRVACKGNTPQEKRLHDTAYKACYERMLSRLATRIGKRMMRLRASTVEPVLGSLITYYGLRQISKKRQVGAAKVFYLAAMAYNLKKYLRTPQQPTRVALALPGHLFWIPLPFYNSHWDYRWWKYSYPSYSGGGSSAPALFRQTGAPAPPGRSSGPQTPGPVSAIGRNHGSQYLFRSWGLHH